LEGIDRKTFALYFFGVPFIGGLIIGFAGEDATCMGVISIVVLIIILYATSARLKNINQNQLLALLMIIPLVNFGMVVYLLVTPPYESPRLEPKGEIKPEKAAGYCPNCGTPRLEGDNFCSKCGNPFSEE
jgi:hypothetical protein